MDRIRPFIALIRTIGARRRTSVGAKTEESQLGIEAPLIPNTEPFQATLRIRLQMMPTWDSARARQIFVEQVLLTELGAKFTHDPEFAALTEEVSKMIAEHPRSSSRLNQLLRSLAIK